MSISSESHYSVTAKRCSSEKTPPEYTLGPRVLFFPRAASHKEAVLEAPPLAAAMDQHRSGQGVAEPIGGHRADH